MYVRAHARTHTCMSGSMLLFVNFSIDNNFKNLFLVNTEILS